MMPARALLAALPLLAMLAACDRSDPPSDQLRSAAEELVDEVAGEVLPSQPNGPFAPRNDCLDLPGAGVFLTSLQRAAELRDTDALAVLADPDVRLGFGGEDGAANMRREFDAPDGAMWDELVELLAMGCAVNEQGAMVMPWYFAQDTGGDPFESMIVTGENVAVHESADAASPVLARVSWDVVTLEGVTDSRGHTNYGQADANGWVKVHAGGDTPATGYIGRADLRSVIDYRLIAERHGGSWKITALLAGD